MLHIDGTHINYDREIIEQMERSQPASLALSYGLRSMPDGARKETVCPNNNATDADSRPTSTSRLRSSIVMSTNRSNTPTGSEMDEDEYVGSESEDSNDSWTTEKYSSSFIMHYAKRYSKSSRFRSEKPFACPVPGCEKRYKTVSGIKYHSKKEHKNNGKVRKRFMCPCGKCYKGAQGLKSHALMIHNSSPKNVLSIPKASGPVEDAEFTLETSSMSSCSSDAFGEQIVTTAIVHSPPSTAIAADNCFYAAQAAIQAAPSTVITAAAANNDATSARIYPPAISPTFVEQKCSANSIKEKMFANVEGKAAGANRSDRKVRRRGNSSSEEDGDTSQSNLCKKSTKSNDSKKRYQEH
uniref:C2H2-type domain-containing protein n=1 Tax=Glossina morsitans morsitans TaxID=37546 RepID=A0A1B0FC90_GLOMM